MLARPVLISACSLGAAALLTWAWLLAHERRLGKAEMVGMGDMLGMPAMVAVPDPWSAAYLLPFTCHVVLDDGGNDAAVCRPDDPAPRAHRSGEASSPAPAWLWRI